MLGQEVGLGIGFSGVVVDVVHGFFHSGDWALLGGHSPELAPDIVEAEVDQRSDGSLGDSWGHSSDSSDSGLGNLGRSTLAPRRA